jgi:hypothetical protein
MASAAATLIFPYMPSFLINRRKLLQFAALSPLAATAGPEASADRIPLDGNRSPFSRSGSYWAVNKLWWSFGETPQTPTGAWYIRLLEDDPQPNEIFRLEILHQGQLQRIAPILRPEILQLGAGAHGSVEFVIPRNELLQARGQDCSLGLYAVLGSYSYAIPRGLNACEVASVNVPRVLVKAHRGTLKLSARWADETLKASCSSVVVEILPDTNGRFECTFEYYDGAPQFSSSLTSFDDAVASARDDFGRFLDTIEPLPAPYESARAVAAWVLWSSTVAPRGLYRNPVVWCSKNWMNRIWSWDHCFVTVGLASADPEFAWQQLMLFKDMQDPHSGVLCDAMSNVQRSWLCTKPPVHGWALSHLMRAHSLSRVQLAEIYEPLAKWTNFWLTDRNLDGDGLPCILNPNESFDNTTGNTLFGPVKAPEIASYLVLQLEALSAVAQKLGHARDAEEWSTRARSLVEVLLQKLWDRQAGKFVARRVGDGKTAEGDCIFSYVPILLGKRLPAAIQQSLTRTLRQPGRFLTPYGLATEALTSPRYNPESYVKGPVWAPPTTFITEGLDAIGEAALASTIRRAFLSDCLRHGMSEHFDAKTGEPSGDSGYNWSAAMFFYLARREE